MADSIYSDLRDERREIRLLFLNAGHPQDAIVATLMVTSLNWAHEYWTPEYETLSYVWGDPLMTRAISLNDQPYHITENLEAALRSLRHAGRVRILWIDALCINQNDPREREHQITLMRDIFEGCASCVVWLGDEDEETERIFDPLYWMQDNLHVHRWPCFDGEIGRHVSEDDLTHGVGPALKPLQNLLNRSWWYRTWTFQEFILPKTHEIRCGRFEIPFDLLVRSQQNFTRHGNSCCMFASNSLMVMARQTKALLGNVVLPLYETRQYLERNDDLDFLVTLEDNCHRIATRDHDKVYGLIGLAPLAVRDSITPNYSLDIAAVYAQPVVERLRSHASLRPLVALRNQDKELQLPSWVPDWSSNPMGGIPPWLRRSRYDLFSACGSQLLHPRIYDHRVLHVRGIKCESLKSLGQIMETFQEGLADPVSNRLLVLRDNYEMAMSENTDQDPSAENFQQTAFWRTMLFDCVRCDGETSLRRAKGSDYNGLRHLFDTGSAPPDEANMSQLLNDVGFNLYRAQFAITTSGGLTMAPLNTQVGDEIYILAGGNMPFVLRPSTIKFSPPGSSDPPQPCHTLVGECYLDQFMDGEYSDRLREDSVDIFII
ncbi:hypothetical protein ACEPPN_019060 [Leptodophora sp. 'Broadleaf-Isolate-01']